MPFLCDLDEISRDQGQPSHARDVEEKYPKRDLHENLSRTRLWSVLWELPSIKLEA